MILELTNPSDPITFVGDDPKVAGVACLLLGNGWYGLTDEKGQEFVPLMIFGSHKAWLAEQGIGDLDEWTLAHASEVADFLDTVAYGSIADRQSYDEAVALMTPKNAKKYAASWNDKRRSSANDIGGAALRLAESLRKLAKDEPVGKDDLKGSPPIVLVG